MRTTLIVFILLFNIGCSQKQPPKVIIKTVNKCSEVFTVDTTKVTEPTSLTLSGTMTSTKDVVLTKEMFNKLKKYITSLKLGFSQYKLKTLYYEEQINKFNEVHTDDRK